MKELLTCFGGECLQFDFFQKNLSTLHNRSDSNVVFVTWPLSQIQFLFCHVKCQWDQEKTNCLYWANRKSSVCILNLKEKMMNYCRLCAELKDPIEIVASLTDAENLIERKLMECFQWPLEITNHRDLPQEICLSCSEKLDKCWLFAKSVQVAQVKLLEIFGE